jgi:DNA-binding winged helix-turn-helix (wHTH) protein
MESFPREQNVPLLVDVEHHLVWKGAERLRLTPKACAVLQYLMARRGHVVAKGALLDTFWPDPAEASEAAMTTCIREIRRKLQDNATAPHYIETVYPRRQTYPGSASNDGGYRFIGPIAPWTAATATPRRARAGPSRPHPPTFLG